LLRGEGRVMVRNHGGLSLLDCVEDVGNCVVGVVWAAAVFPIFE
jgi:hypothetical protein